jgi:methylisocitrate lyase
MTSEKKSPGEKFRDARAMAAAAERVYQTIRETGSQAQVVSSMQTRERLYEILDYHRYERKLDELFGPIS